MIQEIVLTIAFIVALGIVLQWLTVLIRKVKLSSHQSYLLSTCVVVLYCIISGRLLPWI